MDKAGWDRVQELFHQVADLPHPEQQRLLEQACAGDQALLAAVTALLAADADADSLLDRDLGDVASAMLRPDPLQLQQRFGPYQLVRLLGEGGMGVVYLGRRDDLGSEAAIKILRDAWLSPARRERFASEQRTLARLDHPSIARLLDADVLADGTPWFVMEYVAGVTLTEYCRSREVPLTERLRLFLEICAAVQHAHRHAIIHRDLKPSNIMVTAEGGIKLLDFGIAKQLESVESPLDQTRSGLRLMTPAYAAPEQLRGEGLGIHTDVYSLGVVLYELLVGALPFDLSRRTPGEADAIILQQEPERPSLASRRRAAGDALFPALPSHAWADLDILCLTAMQKEPARRYQTVDALRRDVEHFLAGEPLDARPDGVGYRLAKFARRHAAALTVTAIVGLVVIGLVIFDGIRLTRARNAALVEAARTARVEHFMLSLFQGGDASAGPADSLRVTALLDRGVQEARSLSTDPAVQSELYLTLGGIYQKLGQFDRADTLMQLALSQRRTRLGPDHPDVSTAKVALGLLRIDQAKYEEAERLAREALTSQRQRLAADHPEIARAAQALGRALQERGEYAAAVPPLEEAIAIQRARADGTPTPELSEVLEDLADTHFQAGRYDLADSLNREVLVMNRTLHGDHHPTVADILINLGAVQFQRGNYVEAERYDREALAIDLQWYGREHYETGSAMTLVGRALVYQKRFPEAVTILREALAIQEKANGPLHPRVASVLNDLGLAATKAGALAEAEATFRRMDAIYHQVYGDRHFLIAIARSNLGTVFLERKDYARAEAMYRDAVARFTDTQGAQHMNTAIARIKLGRALLREGRAREAERETLAGYELLRGQTAPSVSWLQAARTDLAAVYDSLREPEKAARIRREMADTATRTIGAAKGN